MTTPGEGSLTISDRAELARLWLPWCVARAYPHAPIRIDREPQRFHEARQLRIADLAVEGLRASLSEYERDDGRSVLEAICELARQYSSGELAPIHREALAFALPDGYMLREGSHRSCAMWESSVESFEVTINLDSGISWPIYADEALRT